MSNYKGYLPGMNPNRTRKILSDDDDRYYAFESSTGTFVNNLLVTKLIKFTQATSEEVKRLLCVASTPSIQYYIVPHYTRQFSFRYFVHFASKYTFAFVLP